MHTFSVREAISFGWKTFKKRPWFFIVATLVVGILDRLSAHILNTALDTNPDFLTAFVFYVGDFLIACLIYIGLYHFSLKAHDDVASVSFADLWAPRHFGSFALTSLLYALMIGIGLVLFVVPGVILMLVFFFPLYPIIERGLDPWQAFAYSKRLTEGHRWELLSFLLASLLLNIAGALALLLGLLITLPVTGLATAHVYRMLQRKLGTETV